MTKNQELRIEYTKYAEEKGFSLNPNSKFVDAIITGLLKNEEEKGSKYCPCRRVTGNEEEDKKIICPCEYHEEEIKNDGHCHCRLFMKSK